MADASSSRLLLRLPRMGALWHLVVFVLLWAHGDLGGWRWGLFGVSALGLGLLELAAGGRGPLGRADTSPGWAIGLILLTLTNLVLVSGGLHSPFAVVVVPVSMIIATLQHPRRYPFVGGLVAVVVVLIIEALWRGPGSPLVPPVLAGDRTPWSTGLFGMVLLGAMLVGSAVMGTIRVRLDREGRERQQAEERARLALEKRHDDLVRLSGALAHELKNPMTAVMSLVSHRQRRAEDGSAARAQLAVVSTELERMRDRLDALLTLSRPRGTSVAPGCDLWTVAEDVLSARQVLADGHGVRLIGPQPLDGMEPTAARQQVRADGRKIAQVVENLVHNALEATPTGGTIRVLVGHTARAAILEVRDDGHGIAAEVRERLFDAGATTRPTGSGLGLAICAAIAHQHGGTVQLMDQPEGGCRAVLSLPAGDLASGGAP